ncbi:MAG: efflux RND transporter periplasmic adaptor subunit [Pseudomonadota bacterium]|nr:efflux RND transporter periplasmic adaptor subunit [Pseudomonadota bacterium]
MPLSRRDRRAAGAPVKRLALPALLALTACDKPPPAPPPVRPVFSTLAAETTVDPLHLAGVVAARLETPFSFRVLGRLTARPVNIGDLVKKDETLAAIDPLALQLGVRSAEADLASAEAQLANALGVAERQSTLLKTNTTTQAQVDAAEQARASALAGGNRARAALAKAKEELGYSVLKADFAGVVTNTGAEVGQTVSPGQMVVEIADPALRDAVIDAPDSAAATLAVGDAFEVAAQLDPSVRVSGKVREIAPQADAATRTRRVRIALDKPPNAFRLGSTITAWPVNAPHKAVRLPASAILLKDGKPWVWIVDAATAKVALRPVTLADAGADPVEVTGGLEPAMRVVTAGVHSLVEGQQVRIEQRANP